MSCNNFIVLNNCSAYIKSHHGFQIMLMPMKTCFLSSQSPFSYREYTKTKRGFRTCSRSLGTLATRPELEAKNGKDPGKSSSCDSTVFP